ncbi:MAG: NADP-dependent oxidoreductase [Thermoplasmata archaeon]|nr:NADP-dependent oxidoreductase [Thermoplasmata archaeon]
MEGPPDARGIEHSFRWTESPVPSPGRGEMLLRNLWLSFDPTQVLNMAQPKEEGGVPVGAVMRALTVSRVIESQHPDFRPGDLVHGHAGWEDYTVTEGHGFFETTKVPDGISANLAAGTLGVTGMVAYFGVVEVARPTAGETFVISSAAGGVGSIATQLAKIHGCRVIGIAGGREKCDWLLREAAADAAIDHRTEDVAARLDALCPDGIDIFFDNAGGPILDVALARLRRKGRVIVCGGTARYGKQPSPPGPKNYLQLCMINGRMEGLLGRDYADRFPEAARAMLGWLHSGQLRSKEDVVVGLENAPRALARLFSGANLGKQLLKVADDPAAG